MTKEEVLEKMEEEKESVKSKILYGQSSNSSANGCGWCFDVINHAIDLVEQLDEPKKVIIPQFVADWIEEAKEYYGSEIVPLEIVYWVGNYISDTDSHYEWLKNICNRKLLLNAVINGYEVEKPRRVVKLKGIHGLRKYIRLDDEGKVILGLAGSDGITGGTLTEEEAKEKWPEFEIYYNAGLLEFEEVEDD